MVHLLFLIRRKTGLSRQEFSRHWREIHGPLAANIPGFRRYVQSHVLETQGEEPPYGGVAEIWVDDEGAAREVFQSREYRQGAFVDEPNFVDLERVVRLRTEDHAVLAGSPIRRQDRLIKRISFLKHKPGMTREEFFRYWWEVHGPLAAKLPGLRRYVQCHALPSAYAKGDPPFDGAAQIWFEDLSAMHRVVESKEYREEVRPDVEKFVAPAGIFTLVTEESRMVWPDSL